MLIKHLVLNYYKSENIELLQNFIFKFFKAVYKMSYQNDSLLRKL